MEWKIENSSGEFVFDLIILVPLATAVFFDLLQGRRGGGDFMNLYLPVHMSVWDFLEICYLVFSEILHGDRKLEISDRNEYLVKIFVCFNRIGKKDPK